MLGHLSAEVKKVIVAPLNWGLGHATRSIPVIRKLLSKGIEVILASDGEALELLRGEFPSLAYEPLPTYNVTYKSQSLLSIVLSNSTNVAKAIIAERRAAEKLVKKHQPQLLISDSRFGFRSNRIQSVIISHQLNLQSETPLMRFLLNKTNVNFLNAFDEVWVPDEKGSKWSGVLSQNKRINNVRFIGVLSRFETQEPIHSQSESKFDLLVILSGPEPARTRFESQIIGQLEDSRKKICLVRGSEKLPVLSEIQKWTIIERADSVQLLDLIQGSKKILSRSGYSSILDYIALGRSAYLVPTPGQSEQEYLAEYLNGTNGFVQVNPSKLVDILH